MCSSLSVDLLCLFCRSQVLEQSLAWLRSEAVVHSEAAATALAAVAMLQELPSSQARIALPCHHCHAACMLIRCCARAVRESPSGNGVVMYVVSRLLSAAVKRCRCWRPSWTLRGSGCCQL